LVFFGNSVGKIQVLIKLSRITCTLREDVNAFPINHIEIANKMQPFPLSLDSCRQPQTYVKPEAAIRVVELLMMSGVSLETC